MIKTVRCQLAPTPDQAEALRQTIQKFADCCNEILSESRKLGLRHRYAIQAALYKPMRLKHGINACYGVRACDRVASAIATKRRGRGFNPTSITTDASTCRFIGKLEQISLSTVAGRAHIPLRIGDYQRRLLPLWTPGMGTVSIDRQGRFWVNLRIIQPTTPRHTTDVIGVDLGINRIAAVSTGEVFSGRKLNRIRERHARTVASLQAKGTKGSKRVLKRLSGRIQRFQRDINHQISKGIVGIAVKHNAAIALEDLKGIGKRTAKQGKAHRRRMGRWAFYQLRQFIAYKAEEAGIGVVAVNPRYTSKACPFCHHLGSRDRHKFTCFTCGLVGDADLIGAVNVAAKGLSANQPEIAGSIER